MPSQIKVRLQLRKFHINDIFEKLKLDKFEIKFLEYYVSFGGFKMGIKKYQLFFFFIGFNHS